MKTFQFGGALQLFRVFDKQKKFGERSGVLKRTLLVGSTAGEALMAPESCLEGAARDAGSSVFQPRFDALVEIGAHSSVFRDDM